MIVSPRRLFILLRISLLGLALLTVVGGPIYSAWCDTHQLGHRLAALVHRDFRQDSRAEHVLDAEHACGAHGLLHDSDQSTYAVVAAVILVPDICVDSVPNAVAVELPQPVQRLARPFRPPIA